MRFKFLDTWIEWVTNLNLKLSVIFAYAKTQTHEAHKS